MPELIAWIQATFGPDVDWKQVVLFAMTPLFILGFVAEFLWMRYRTGHWDVREPGQRFYWKETRDSTFLGLGYYGAETVMQFLIVGAVFAWAWEHPFFTLPINAWTIVAAFFVEEFCYYWYHRSAHRIRWFWTQHVSHHSSETMNMSTAARQSILNGIIGVWFFFLPPVLLGFHPGLMLFMLGVNLSYQWFIHTESIPRLHPVLEWIFDTASNHRVHHGRNAAYIDRNYGGVLMIYDHLFGTYAAEKEKVDFGITNPVHSRNWLVLNFHEFIDLWRDVLAPGPLWLRLQHFWRPPEWERPGHQAKRGWSKPSATTATNGASNAESARQHASR